MRKVAVINQKGGVGKTTTTVNLGAALAERGQRVLLIDLDPQANLGTHLGIDINRVQPTIYDVLVSGVPLEQAMVPTTDERLSVVPSNLDLSAAEMELVSMVGRETILRDALEVLEQSVGDRFDTVLLDCPPSLGVLSINALCAAEDVLVPLQAEFFALQGMAKLTEVIGLVQRRLNPRVQLKGIVACKVDRRTRLTQEVLDEVQRYFGDRLMRTMIRPNVKLAEAPSYGQTVIAYAPESNGSADYRQLAREWLGESLEDPEELLDDAADANPLGDPWEEPLAEESTPELLEEPVLSAAQASDSLAERAAEPESAALTSAASAPSVEFAPLPSAGPAGAPWGEDGSAKPPLSAGLGTPIEAARKALPALRDPQLMRALDRRLLPRDCSPRPDVPTTFLARAEFG